MDTSSSTIDVRAKVGAIVIAFWGAISYMQWLLADFDSSRWGGQLLTSWDLTRFFEALRPRALFASGAVGAGVLGGYENLGIGWVIARLNFSAPRLIAPLAVLTLLTGLAAAATLLPSPPMKREHLTLIAVGGALLHPLLYFVQRFPLLPWQDPLQMILFIPALVITSALPVVGAGLLVPKSLIKRATSRVQSSGIPPTDVAPQASMPNRPVLPSQPAAYGVEPVGNGLRFGAYLLDGLLAVVTCLIGWFIWSIILWSRGQTPAKQLLNLRVVDVSTGQTATGGQMALRELVGKFLLSFLSCGITNLVGAIMVLASSKRQGLWDTIAGTTVTRAI